MRKSDPNLNNSTTQKGVITHTLGNLITVWPLNLNQEKEIVFNDFPTISSQTLHVGDWIQMEVDSGDIIVYREKISPILPTYVSARGDVRVKTQLYFPNGLVTRGKNLIAYSDDFGPIGIFFPCPEIDAKFSYDVWVTRPNKKYVSVAKECNAHWCLVRQTLIASKCSAKKPENLEENWVLDSIKNLSCADNIINEEDFKSQPTNFSLAVNFTDFALKTFYSYPEVREAVRKSNIHLAYSVEAYLRNIQK